MQSPTLRPPEELDPLTGRYAKLLTGLATAGGAESGPMSAALALCDALAGRPIRRVKLPRAAAECRDGGGHARPFYAGLVAYAVGLAARLRPPGEVDLPPLLDDHRARVWRDTLTYGSHAMLKAGRQPTAAEAGSVTADLWDELAGLALGDAGDLTTLPRVVAAQDDCGAFFRFDGDLGDNPEPWWYHELVALHAVASYAATTGDAAAAGAARRSAAFHHAETQPDHATGQPWAVHAFLRDPDAAPTADLLLLAATTGQPSSLGIVPRVLLADAAVWLLAAPTVRA